eukprot:6439849-Prymnesium_polylepis.1
MASAAAASSALVPTSDEPRGSSRAACSCLRSSVSLGILNASLRGSAAPRAANSGGIGRARRSASGLPPLLLVASIPSPVAGAPDTALPLYLLARRPPAYGRGGGPRAGWSDHGRAGLVVRRAEAHAPRRLPSSLLLCSYLALFTHLYPCRGRRNSATAARVGTPGRPACTAVHAPPLGTMPIAGCERLSASPPRTL